MLGVAATPLTGTNNTAVGSAALYSAQGAAGSNTAIGASALHGNTTGGSNTAVGYQSLLASTGSSNTAVGFSALYATTTGNNAALLTGKLFDANGEPLYVQGAVKGQRRYRYYVSKRLVRGESQEPEQQWRLSATEIERAVSAGARTMLGDRAAIALVLEKSGIDSVPVRCADEFPSPSPQSCG
jgi:hypothetical protein